MLLCQPEIDHIVLCEGYKVQGCLPPGNHGGEEEMGGSVGLAHNDPGSGPSSPKFPLPPPPPHLLLHSSSETSLVFQQHLVTLISIHKACAGMGERALCTAQYILFKGSRMPFVKAKFCQILLQSVT